MKIGDYINNWIKNISKKQKDLNGYAVCPFAKTATFKIIQTKNNQVILPEEEYEVILFVLSDDIQVEDQIKLCKRLCLQHKEYVFLPDFKERKTYIKSVETGNGKYNLILCQSKEKLNKARDILKKTNYYDNWDKNYYNEIMSYGK